MTDRKSHTDAAPFAIRAVGRGFALHIRQFLDARAARRLRRRAEREMEMLPPELQRDVGWPGRRSHDGI
ncbi:hypothetical protein [Rhizobium sp. GN54]|uniref:hypothetical protein n=1 Tax=Rhizobium sp. GN54 TaxID=2898150 RepID=UPI001E34D444|nr:hypothetical protein [Rhizobium sp. GN54]MCD2181935.1 hypothetical protein [Rhizobium sp. GN54]